MSSLNTVCGKEVRIAGRMLRIARLEADAYQFVDNDTVPVLEALRQVRPRIDVFTFVQGLPETQPRYNYPMEWDNFAALQVTDYEHWWNEQIGFKARNKAKQALKKGVVVREVPFDDDLVKGNLEVYNESPLRQGARTSITARAWTPYIVKRRPSWTAVFSSERSWKTSSSDSSRWCKTRPGRRPG